MTKLKIAMVTGRFPTVSETFVVNQIKSLKKMGHHADVFCFKKNKSAEFSGYYNVDKEVLELRWEELMPDNKAIRFFKILKILVKAYKKNRAARMLKSSLFFKGKVFNTHLFFKTYFQYYFNIENYEVIHVHFANNAVRMLPQLQTFKGRVVVTFHGFDAHKYDGVFYRDLFGLPNLKVTVNTNFTFRKVLNLGAVKSQVTILPVGLDTNFFSPQRQPHSGFNIVFTGRLIPLKAPLLTIKIFEQLISKKKGDFHLYMIGDGIEHSVCEAYIKESSLSKFVTLLGNASQEMVKVVMNKCDVLLFPGIIDDEGRCEAQGLVVQEAQSMQLPVVVSDVGGIKEGMIDGETGFAVKNGDIDDFIEKLLYLIKHEEKREHMGEKARQFVAANYDNSILGMKLLNVYTV